MNLFEIVGKIFIALLSICLIGFFIELIFFWLKPLAKVDGKHVLITGGSKGIGKALAKNLVQMGAKVTITARSEATLTQACKEIQDLGTIQWVRMDVTDFDDTSKAVTRAMEKNGPIDYLITCAGNSVPDYLVHQNIDKFTETCNLNYMGTVNAVKAVIPEMVKQKQGHIVLIGSAMSLIGFAGYASYAPSKWAVRGFADCIRNEFLKFGIKVSVSYPPDTNTPGFELETATRTPEIKSLSSDSDVYDAEHVSDLIVQDFLKGKYHLSSPDFIQNMLISAQSGLSPRSFFFFDILIAPLMVIVLEAFRRYVDYVSMVNPIKVSKIE